MEPGSDMDGSGSAVESDQGRFEFGLHPAGGYAVADQGQRLGGGEGGRSFAGSVADSLNVGQKKQLSGAEGYRAGGRHLVAVDVVDGSRGVSRDTRDYG